MMGSEGIQECKHRKEKSEMKDYTQMIHLIRGTDILLM